MTEADMTEEDIFREACRIDSPESRAAYVDRVSRGDQVLRQRVLDLLAACDADSRFLEAPPPELAKTRVPDSAGLSPGAEIGPYKLLQEIGSGGMGVVFMAEQREPVRRRVALKVIRPGMDSQQVLARFEAERQALSLMDHPHIARVFDVGTAVTGQPYFAMELVKGRAITEYCDERRLSLRDRLRLLVPVCEAVQHAHQKGIIHRDMKPSNVLVAEFDERPMPKVIDFGVAKAIHQPLTQRTMFTALGQLIGTPEYMSPEQARLNQLDVDTRSDIYSLGVLMYELLTGTTPLERERMQTAAWEELLRLIREDEAPCPSVRLSSTPTLPAIASLRRAEPTQLVGLLRGELDWVIMKALEKQRDRRYETARHLADDLQRYLESRPVMARPPTPWYLLRKFTARHRAAISVLTLALVLLLAGVTGTSIGLVSAMRSEDAARTAQAAAEVQSRRAVANARRADQQRAAAEASLKAAVAARQRADEKERALQQELHRSRKLSYANQLRAAHAELRRGAFASASGVLNQTRSEFRGWEYLCLRGILDAGRTDLDAPGGEVNDVAFSPDGSKIAMAGSDGKVTVCDAGSGQLVASAADHSKPVTAICWSRDQRVLLSGDDSGRILAWDMPSDAPPRDIADQSTEICCVEFLEDDQRFVSVSVYGDVTIRSITSGEILRSLPTGLGGARTIAAALTPDQTAIVVVGAEDFERRRCRMRLLRLADGSLVREFDTAGTGVTNVAFSPDGARLATGSGWPLGFGADKRILLWDVASGRCDQELQGSANPVEGLVFSPSGQRLYSTGQRDGSVTVWDLSRATVEQHLRSPAGLVTRFSLNSDGTRLCCGSRGMAHVWTLPPIATSQSTRLPGPLMAAVFDRHGRNLLVASGVLKVLPFNDGTLLPETNGQLIRWDRDTQESTVVLDDCVPARELVRSPYGRLAAALHDGGTVRVLDLDTWQVGATWDISHQYTLGDLTFVDDETLCVIHDRQFDLHRVPSGDLIRSRSLPSYAREVSVAGNPPRAAVIWGSTLSVLDIGSGDMLFSRALDSGFVAGLAIADDGRHVALAERNGVLTLIDTEQDRDVWTATLDSGGQLLFFQEDERLFVGGRGRVMVFETRTGIELLSLTADDDSTTGIDLAPTGRQLASTSIDGLLHLWLIPD